MELKELDIRVNGRYVVPINWVLDRVDISKSKFTKLIKEGFFEKPLKIGNALFLEKDYVAKFLEEHSVRRIKH